MKPLKCSVKYFCFGSLLIFIGSVLLCSFGITVVLPYRKTKDWTPMTCNVSSTVYNTTVCSCDQQEARTDCSEIYPCLQVQVQYTYHIKSYLPRMTCPNHHPGQDRERNLNYVEQGSNCTYNLTSELVDSGVVQNAVLYKTWSDSFFQTCSLHVCDEKQWNNKEVDKFHKAWGRKGKSFTCYADPSDLDTVILNRTTYGNSVHAMLWPTICLSSGAFIWCGLYVGCWVIESKEKGYCPQRTYIL